MYDRMALTVSGRPHVLNVDILWGKAVSVLFNHSHPKIVVDCGAISVLPGASFRLDCCMASSTLVQLSARSDSVSPPTYRSSATLAAIPSWIRCPMTRHINSSRAVSEPGMPIAHRV